MTLFSINKDYQLTALNDWNVIPGVGKEIADFSLYSEDRKREFYAFAEDHVMSIAYTYENFCNIVIKDWFCDELNIVFPDTYSEEIALGQKVRWYEDHDIVDDNHGGRDDYFCCVAEIGEKETDKKYFVAYGFIDELDHDAKEEYLNMIDSIKPVLSD